jgi:hypothetical protein
MDQEKRETLVDIEIERVEVNDQGTFIALTFKLIFRLN